MSARYIIRLDDVHSNMNFSFLCKFVELCRKNNVVPLLGVIPFNTDKSLYSSDSVSEDVFWKHLSMWSSNGIVECGLHGYSHFLEKGTMKSIAISHVNGLFGEFVNEEVCSITNKLRHALDVMSERQIEVKGWISPAHYLTDKILKSCENVGLTQISDGVGLIPIFKGRIALIPQQFEKPRKMPFGVVTFCVHPNDEFIDKFDVYENFFKKNNKNFIKFSSAVNYNKGIFYEFINFPFKIIIFFTRWLRISKYQRR